MYHKGSIIRDINGLKKGTIKKKILITTPNLLILVPSNSDSTKTEKVDVGI